MKIISPCLTVLYLSIVGSGWIGELLEGSIDRYINQFQEAECLTGKPLSPFIKFQLLYGTWKFVTVTCYVHCHSHSSYHEEFHCFSPFNYITPAWIMVRYPIVRTKQWIVYEFLSVYINQCHSAECQACCSISQTRCLFSQKPRADVLYPICLLTGHHIFAILVWKEVLRQVFRLLFTNFAVLS